MEQKLQELRQYIESFRNWIDHSAAPLCQEKHPEMLRQWREDLTAVETVLNQNPELPIAMLGPSQQGKSTLINALLDAQILAVGGAVGGAVGACTCVITSVHYEDIDDYRAEIQFIQLEDWRQELQQLRETLQSTQSTEDTESDRGELQFQNEAATEKIKAVYGVASIEDFDFSVVDSPFCGLEPEITQYMKGVERPLELRQNAPLSLRNAVRRYMVGRNQYAGTDRQYWPIINEIRIFGKFPILAEGLVLVDLPGLDDPNPARELVTRRYLEQARYLWMICNSQTGINRVFATMLREGRLLLRLYLEGRLPEFSVVATHADNFDLAAVLPQMGINPYSGQFDINEVAKFRNNEVRKFIREQLHGLAQGIIGNTGDLAHNQLFLKQVSETPIFPVASASYLFEKGLNPLFIGHRLAIELTNFPQLKEHLQNITFERSLQHKIVLSSKNLEILQSHAINFFRDKTQEYETLTQNVQEQWGQLQNHSRSAIEESRNHIQIYTAQTRHSLELRCELFYREIEQLDYEIRKDFKELFLSWRQINWRTLQAIVKNKGAWYSKSLERRFNLNDDVAAAFLLQISLKWEQFFSDHLRKVIEDLTHDYMIEISGLVQKLKGQINMLTQAPPQLVELLTESLKTAERSYDLQSASIAADVNHQIGIIRQNLVKAVFDTVADFMQPAYLAARNVPTETGVKQKMLDALERPIHTEATLLIQDIRREIQEGLVILQTDIQKSFDRLCAYANQLIEQMETNIQNSPPVTPQEKELFRSALSELPALHREEFVDHASA